jgi:TM2 domain-containing membrane protein YozV
MATTEPNNEDQFHSPSTDQDNQSPSSTPQERQPQPEIQSPEAILPSQEFTPSSSQVCPYCQQTHPEGTLYCPVTGRPLTPASRPESNQSAQGPTPPPAQGYYPPQPQYPGGGQQPYYPPYYLPRPLKDRNVALVLELLPGLLGVLGIGWIYSGKTSTGIAWLIGYLVWVGIVIAAAFLSGFTACFCTVPINLVCVGISASMLNNYTKSQPQLFGR